MKIQAFRRIAAAILLVLSAAPQARADDTELLCTVVSDAAGKVLLEEGPACGERVTPASTFKVALAVMGFDAGFLVDRDNPVLPFKEGYPDWIAEWRKPIGPTDWMRYSVVWYSQQIARKLGADTLEGYAGQFGYGNADFSGDPGKYNGLDRAWIGSSLKISPREQVAFLGRLATGRLPVADGVAAKAVGLLEVHKAGDGTPIRGKTGSAFPRKADGDLDRARGWGWYVGWTEVDGRLLVLAHLRQDRSRVRGPNGIRARDDLLRRWPALLASLCQATAGN